MNAQETINALARKLAPDGDVGMAWMRAITAGDQTAQMGLQALQWAQRSLDKGDEPNALRKALSAPQFAGPAEVRDALAEVLEIFDDPEMERAEMVARVERAREVLARGFR